MAKPGQTIQKQLSRNSSERANSIIKSKAGSGKYASDLLPFVGISSNAKDFDKKVEEMYTAYHQSLARERAERAKEDRVMGNIAYLRHSQAHLPHPDWGHEARARPASASAVRRRLPQQRNGIAQRRSTAPPVPAFQKSPSVQMNNLDVAGGAFPFSPTGSKDKGAQQHPNPQQSASARRQYRPSFRVLDPSSTNWEEAGMPSRAVYIKGFTYGLDYHSEECRTAAKELVKHACPLGTTTCVVWDGDYLREDGFLWAVQLALQDPTGRAWHGKIELCCFSKAEKVSNLRSTCSHLHFNKTITMFAWPEYKDVDSETLSNQAFEFAEIQEVFCLGGGADLENEAKSMPELKYKVWPVSRLNGSGEVEECAMLKIADAPNVEVQRFILQVESSRSPPPKNSFHGRVSTSPITSFSPEKRIHFSFGLEDDAQKSRQRKSPAASPSGSPQTTPRKGILKGARHADSQSSILTSQRSGASLGDAIEKDVYKNNMGSLAKATSDAPNHPTTTAVVKKKVRPKSAPLRRKKASLLKKQSDSLDDMSLGQLQSELRALALRGNRPKTNSQKYLAQRRKKKQAEDQAFSEAVADEIRAFHQKVFVSIQQANKWCHELGILRQFEHVKKPTGQKSMVILTDSSTMHTREISQEMFMREYGRLEAAFERDRKETERREAMERFGIPTKDMLIKGFHVQGPKDTSRRSSVSTHVDEQTVNILRKPLAGSAMGVVRQKKPSQKRIEFELKNVIHDTKKLICQLEEQIKEIEGRGWNRHVVSSGCLA